MIIIDCGHGGIIDGKYVTAPNKMHTFNDGLTIYEGVINRAIGSKLEARLQEVGIKFFSLNTHDQKDMPLHIRTDKINKIAGPNDWVLSIHSNAGGGKGFEIFTSVGETYSDTIADILAAHYKANFPNIKFRQDMTDGDADKEANFWMLRKTKCPSVLVENLFFDNREEAELLMSDEFQMEIADALFDGIKEIEL